MLSTADSKSIKHILLNDDIKILGILSSVAKRDSNFTDFVVSITPMFEVSSQTVFLPYLHAEIGHKIWSKFPHQHLKVAQFGK